MDDGTREMVAIPGEDRLFATWREAFVAGLEAGGPTAGIYTQAVLLDNNGAVAFPPDDMPTRSLGLWQGKRRNAAAVQPAPDSATDETKAQEKVATQANETAPHPQKCKRIRTHRGRWAHATPKDNEMAFSPEVAGRLAEIRKTLPRFGIADERSLPSKPQSR
jgi:hypothetical protein